jgi:hypothetical protein
VPGAPSARGPLKGPREQDVPHDAVFPSEHFFTEETYVVLPSFKSSKRDGLLDPYHAFYFHFQPNLTRPIHVPLRIDESQCS